MKTKVIQSTKDKKAKQLPTIDVIEKRVVPYLLQKKDYEYLLIIHLLSDTFLTVAEVLELKGFNLRMLARWDKDSGITFGNDILDDEDVFKDLSRQKINLKLKKIQRACGLTEYDDFTTHTLRKIGALHLREELIKSGKTEEEALRILMRKLAHYSIESIIQYLGVKDPREKKNK